MLYKVAIFIITTRFSHSLGNCKWAQSCWASAWPKLLSAVMRPQTSLRQISTTPSYMVTPSISRTLMSLSLHPPRKKAVWKKKGEDQPLNDWRFLCVNLSHATWISTSFCLVMTGQLQHLHTVLCSWHGSDWKCTLGSHIYSTLGQTYQSTLGHLLVLTYSTPKIRQYMKKAQWAETLSECALQLSNVHFPFNHIGVEEHRTDTEVVRSLFKSSLTAFVCDWPGLQ